MTTSQGRRGGQGYAFNGAKAKALGVRLSALKRANELDRWPPQRVEELADHLANGLELDAIAKQMGAPQGELNRAFARLCRSHPQFC